jgi:hypothetical protein
MATGGSAAQAVICTSTPSIVATIHFISGLLLQEL